MTDAIAALTEKEKQALRLLVRGHDAKSIARALGLSVHTVNERLRDARRKLSVSSSREAARLLLAREDAPQRFGDSMIGDAPAPQSADPAATQPASRRLPIVAGGVLMSFAAALLAALTVPGSAPPPAPASQTDPAIARTVETAARDWLALLDRSDWAASYAATAASFRQLNTLEVWTAASEKVRRPLGAVRSRALVAQESVPAPPNGVEMVKFRTSYANRADVIETVSLAKEDGAWRVVGIYAD